MSRTVPVGVDMRGFAWPLASFERKLEQDLERQRVRLAAARREFLALQSELAASEARHRDGSRATDAGALGSVDPAARRRTLAYLLRELEGLSLHRHECERLRKVAEVEAEALLRADRALSAAREMRARALSMHVAEQVRRQCREADFAWLARGVGAARGGA